MKNKFVLYFFLIVSLQLFAQNERYEVFNTSINSRDADFGISYMNDSTVIYASSKKTENDKVFSKDRRRNNRQFFIDIYTGKISNGDIFNEQKFTKEVNNKFFMSDISFTNDQKTVYFTWNNFYDTTSRKDSAKWKTLYIVKASITKDLEILSIEKLPFNSDDYSVRSPELSIDESQLFFTSDMKGGYGESDIYVVDIYENGTYSEPRNLGPNVNTTQPEMYPHAAENGNLYFSSEGHNSTGGFDIFKSDFINGKYDKAQKLPDPINTQFDDFSFAINVTDNSGFFTSTRKKGIGDADIYSFQKFIICSKEISGNILDINSKEQLSNVHIQLIADDEILDEITTENNGFYSFKLDCELDYKLKVSKQYYEDSELSFSTNTNFEDKTIENILLNQKECLQILDLEIVHQETDELLTDVSLKLFKNNEEINLFENLDSIKIDCNSKYKIVTEKIGFISNAISFISSKEYNEKLFKKIVLTPVKCYQNFTGTIVDKITQQELNNLKVYLISNEEIINEIDLDSYKLNFTLDCIQEFKIKVEKTNYKTSEFDVTTTDEMKKVIFETIELEPLECNQTINISVLNDLQESLSGALIQLYKNNEIVTTIESNNQKSILEFDCENTYKIVVSKENYISQEYGFTTSRQYDLGLTKQFELLEKDCNQVISGTVSNSENNNSISNAKVTLFRGSNQIQTIFTKEDATYSFEINCNNNYKIVVEKTDFDSKTYDFNTNAEFDNSLTKNILIEPSKCDQTVVLIVINSISKEVVNAVNVSLFENNELIQTKLSSGKTEFNLTCNKQYKIVISKENFTTKEFIFNTDNVHQDKLKETIELSPKVCSQSLNIIITNENTNEQLSNLEFVLTKDGLIIESISLKTKNLVLNVECNATYKIAIKKENFKSKEVEFSSSADFFKKNTKTLKLQPLSCLQYISGAVLSRKLGTPIANATIDIYLKDDLINTYITENNGKFNIELDCKLDYKIITSANDFLNDLVIINTTSQYDKEFKTNIYLNDKESQIFEEKENVKTVKMYPINFELNESRVTASISKELDKLIETLNKYPNLKLEIKNHTDSRAPDNYNLRLSEERASSLVRYIIANGIENARVSGKGYGETALLNKCSNGVKCSEEEHQLNRRTEFIVNEK